ncbi:hypothetical protein [Pseudomonas typographi]|uniref:Class I SAM-dependent methyltransferase n=1 Tax=Pseudomonas typographi TaxID=2715964 RepID=A0ABR7Z9Y7_9PSED|nr:hypothetical protein [Pseudomonas typographi]MBD1555175.1 class I SAM-dependent methyltransferase [Pseudomonas typographi]MBD1589964.1 class I SAM-dependent methyltransferase [Pseudomonas typographi]MBD1602365.1 class I SAM-dependent methyltransferase [Pseudomonas typographi]
MISREEFEKLMLHAGKEFECDKVFPHSYHRYYAMHLNELYGQAFKMLEIGVGGEDRPGEGGASLKMWSKLFPSATIYAWDIYPKHELDKENVKTFIVDQGDPDAIKKFCDEYGPFDIIIDDGSHRRSDQLASLFNLVGAVSDGGLYVIEDYFTSYWPVYDGSTLAIDFLDSPVRWIKRAVDMVNRQNLLSLQVRQHLPDWGIESLHVYPGICVFKKHLGTVERSIPNDEFHQNQVELDHLRYGKYEDIFLEFMEDPMRLLDEIMRLRNGKS